VILIVSFDGNFKESVMGQAASCRIACFLSLVLVPMHVRAAEPVPQTQPVPVTSFPTFGLNVSPPPGWTAKEPDGDNIPTLLELVDKSGRQIANARIQVVAKNGGAFKTFVADLVAKTSGTVDPVPAKIDGLTAIRLRPSIPQGAGEAFLVEHDDTFVMVAVGAPTAGDCDTALDAVTEKLHWVPVESAEKHLEFRSVAVAACDGAITMNFPVIMRPVREKNPVVTHMSIMDFKTGKVLCLAYIQIVPIALTTDAQRKAFLDSLQAQFAFDPPLAFDALPGQPDRFITAFSRATKGPIPKEANATYAQWFLYSKQNQSVLINFSSYDSSPEQRKLLEDLGRNIAASVSFTPQK
jgi:hypothetical protein